MAQKGSRNDVDLQERIQCSPGCQACSRSTVERSADFLLTHGTRAPRFHAILDWSGGRSAIASARLSRLGIDEMDAPSYGSALTCRHA